MNTEYIEYHEHHTVRLPNGCWAALDLRLGPDGWEIAWRYPELPTVTWVPVEVWREREERKNAA